MDPIAHRMVEMTSTSILNFQTLNLGSSMITLVGLSQYRMLSPTRKALAKTNSLSFTDNDNVLNSGK